MAGEKNSKYKPEYDEQGYNYCLLGAQDKQLAEFFKVTEQTINNWKKDHPTFFESLKRGKAEYDVRRVENSLLNRALGYDWEETKQEDGTNGSKTVTTNKHVPADVGAIAFYLKNRDPERWRDKQEHKQEEQEAQSLNISFEVKQPVGDVKITEGSSDN